MADDPYAFPGGSNEPSTEDDIWTATTGGAGPLVGDILGGGPSAEELRLQAALGGHDILQTARNIQESGVTPFYRRGDFGLAAPTRNLHAQAYGQAYRDEFGRAAPIQNRVGMESSSVGRMSDAQQSIARQGYGALNEQLRQMRGGPTAAQGMLMRAYQGQLANQRQGLDRAIQNSNALAASQRGNLGASRRQAQLNESRLRNQAAGQRALIAQQYAGQMGQLRAQEQLGAQQRFANVLGGMNNMYGQAARTSAAQSALSAGLAGAANNRAGSAYDRSINMTQSADQLQGQNAGLILGTAGLGADLAGASAQMEQKSNAAKAQGLGSVLALL